MMKSNNKNFGFGCMRIPMIGKKIDEELFTRMVDRFLEAGFQYFDTAHGYQEFQSEIAIKDCLTSRYPRDQYILTDKLSTTYFEKEEEIRPLFEKQLQCCGVDYFDYYLMHAQNTETFEKYKKCHAYEIALALKEEGKIRYFGISFHDSAQVLEQILTEYPQIEVVQIQFNYLDYESPAIESRKCYEVCRKYRKPVIIMEPVKGGALADPPKQAKQIFDDLGGGSPASYAIRFAAGFEGVMMVLSGMSSMEQMEENIGFMTEFQPLSQEELAALDKVREVFQSLHLIPCTACRYCVEGCPKKISIPDLFALRNQYKIFQDFNSQLYYETVYTVENGKASDCVKCGQCEKICPQHLKIRDYMEEVARTFERTETSS